MGDRYAASMSIWKAPGKLLIYVQKLNLKKDLVPCTNTSTNFTFYTYFIKLHKF
jgi:hypothetical protein